MAVGDTPDVYVPPTFSTQQSIEATDPSYSATGGAGIWRLRSDSSDTFNNGIERYISTRDTKWFALSDYEKPTKVRRIMMSYSSRVNICVEVYKDHEITPAFSLYFPPTFQRDGNGIAVQGEPKLVYKKATTRARILKLRIKTPSITSNNYDNSPLEIYGVQIEVVQRRGKSS